MCEEEIIESIRGGDQHAFKQLVETYQQMVSGTCYAFIHNKEEAKDITQDVFVQVYESIGSFRGECKLSTWIYRIAVNRSINYRRSLRGRIQRINIEQWNRQKEICTDELLPQEAMEKQERINLLHRAIDHLPLNQRTVLILNKYEDLSYKEITEITGFSLSSVESLLFRARQNLEKFLNRNKHKTS